MSRSHSRTIVASSLLLASVAVQLHAGGLLPTLLGVFPADAQSSNQCPATTTTAQFEGNQGPWEDVFGGDAHPPSFVANVQAGGTVKVNSATGTYSARIYHGNDELPLSCDRGTLSFTNNANATIHKVKLFEATNGVTVPAGATKAYVSHDEPGADNYFDNSGNRDNRAPCVVSFSVTPASCGAIPACRDGVDNDGDGLVDLADPGCSNPDDNDETNQVQNVDLAIQKSGPASVVRGQQTIFYTITVANNGNAQATNVVVTDPIPQGLQYNDALSYGPCSQQGSNVVCTQNTISAGQSGSFQIAFDAPAQQNCSTTNVTNTVSIRADQQDNVPGNNNASQSSPTRIDCPAPTPQCRDGADNDGDGLVDFPADPGCSTQDDNDEFNQAQTTVDLSTQKTGPATATRGQQITYGIAVRNNGAVTATNVVVADPIPSGFTYVPSQSSPACAQQGTAVFCTASSIAGNQTANFTLVFNIPTIQNCQTMNVSNQAGVDAAQGDHAPHNNVSQVITNVRCPDPLPLPQCRDGADNDGDGLVDFPSDPGCSSADDNDEFNQTQNVDLAIQKSSPGPVVRGQTIFYTITVANSGTAQATNVVITDPIPSGLNYNDALSYGPCSQQGSNVVCTMSDVNAGQSGSFQIAFDTPAQQNCATTNVTNTISIRADQQDNVPGNNAATQLTPTRIDCPAPTPQCSDNLDNDGDGRVDFPQDPGCSNAQDNNEADDPAVYGCIEAVKETFDPQGSQLPITPQFTFMLDATHVAYNNALGIAHFNNVLAGQHTVAEVVPDGWVQLSVSPAGGSVTVTGGTNCARVTFRNQQSFSQLKQCYDGVDNDGDGLKDFPADPGCASASDNDEWNTTYVPQCRDGVDNDGDGLKDYPQDPGCAFADDNNEQNQTQQTYACNDNLDNDNDGRVDYPQDPGCSSATDSDEFNFRAPRCSDGIDNDSDGLTDFPADAGCATAYDDNEWNDRTWIDRWREWWNWNW